MLQAICRRLSDECPLALANEFTHPTQTGHRIGKADRLETVIRGFSRHEHQLTAGALVHAFQRQAVPGESAP